MRPSVIHVQLCVCGEPVLWPSSCATTVMSQVDVVVGYV